MTDEDFDLWFQAFSEDQIKSLRSLRFLIMEHTNGLQESVNDGKWLTGFVFYSIGSSMIYAIGLKGKLKTTLHMMPFYGSAELQERHGTALSSFLTGKSCIAFRKYSDLPISNLVDIFELGTPVMRNMLMAERNEHHR
jgi:hypothetical protein